MCKLKTWTVDEMLGEHPCEEYDKEKLTELKAGRKKLSMLDILPLKKREIQSYDISSDA